jgi:hypothetical protein
MSNFAKDVAKELEKRSRRRKLVSFAVVAALVALAITYLQCGSGFGLGGGKGKGKGGEGVGSAKSNEPARCTIRVSAEGIFVDGTKTTRDEAVKHCKKTDGAMVTVTGDARQGDWDELRAALEAVGVKIYLRGQLWDGSNAPKQQ